MGSGYLLLLAIPFTRLLPLCQASWLGLPWTPSARVDTYQYAQLDAS